MLEIVKLVPEVPFDHVTVPAQPLAESINVEGEQTTKVTGGVIVGAAGLALISRPVTAALGSDVQPLTVQVAVIEYVPMLESVKLVPEVPFDQLTVPAQPDAESVSVDGEQTERLTGGVIVEAAGLALISRPVTAELGSDVQPLTVQVAVIEYVPTAEIVKLVPVAAPCDQVIVPAQPDAVSVSVEGEQTTKLAGGVIVGAAGLALISRPVTALLGSDVQPLTVQIAVIA